MLGIEVGGDELVLEELGQQMMVEDREDVRLPMSVVEMSSQSIQVPEIPRQAYKEAEQRTQQKMRAKAINNLSAPISFPEPSLPLSSGADKSDGFT